MKSISQVAKLTGISIRTLQYYDEIGLLKPSKLTSSGYRLYDDDSLQTLQQILFFKELGFQLKEINEILKKPDFDRIAAFKKQKELFLLKRNRINKLIKLLECLEKGEPCMRFKEFDLSDYITALENFKSNKTDEIIKHWGSIENFNMFIQKVKDDESEVAKLAIKQFGSVEQYTEAMKYNLEHFSEIMENQQIKNQDLIQKRDALYSRLTSDRNKDVASEEIQAIVKEIVLFTQETTSCSSMNPSFWNMIIESYSNDLVKSVNDKKYGAGASEYIAKSFQYYFQNNNF